MSPFLKGVYNISYISLLVVSVSFIIEGDVQRKYDKSPEITVRKKNLKICFIILKRNV